MYEFIVALVYLSNENANVLEPINSWSQVFTIVGSIRDRLSPPSI